MTLRSIFRLAAAAVVVSLGWNLAARAADQPAAPAPAAPSYAPAAEVCPTCAAGGAAGATPGCTSCAQGSSRFGRKPCKPYVTHLCPGACFGYFQTQWHRWEDVCPIPYQGVGLNDSPPRPTPALASPRPLSDLPKGGPVDPKTKGSDAPLPKPAAVPPGTVPMPAPMPPTPGGTLPMPTPGKF